MTLDGVFYRGGAFLPKDQREPVAELERAARIRQGAELYGGVWRRDAGAATHYQGIITSRDASGRLVYSSTRLDVDRARVEAELADLVQAARENRSTKAHEGAVIAQVVELVRERDAQISRVQ